MPPSLYSGQPHGGNDEEPEGDEEGDHAADAEAESEAGDEAERTERAAEVRGAAGPDSPGDAEALNGGGQWEAPRAAPQRPQARETDS